jgi:molecular chaperone DnaK
VQQAATPEGGDAGFSGGATADAGFEGDATASARPQDDAVEADYEIVDDKI